MTRYARMDGDIVAEIIQTEKPLGDIYHAAIAALFVPVGDNVTPGMERSGDGGFETPPGPDIAALKAALAARVDTDAEAIRAKYITPGAGQAMAYLEKARQAVAYLAAEAPDEADYPLLVAEVGITGETLLDVSTVIQTMQRRWMAVCAQIEPIRIRAKEDIATAETADAVTAVYDAIAWPEPDDAP